MKSVIYILKRIYIRLVLEEWKKYQVYPNIFYKKKKEIPIRLVLFFFPDPVMMHLGDQLFYEPICRLFRENRVKVNIAPTKAMANYFKEDGFNIIDDVDFSCYDLIISSTRFVNCLKKVKNNVVLVWTEYPYIDKPLINDLLEKFSHLFFLNIVISERPSYFNSRTYCEKFDLDPDKEYILYNNYLVSGSFRVNSKQFKKLEDFLLNFIKEHPRYKVIHTGSKKELVKDKRNYHFVDVDLRGRTTVSDLFDLCSLENVVYYIGFDGFLMHLFFLQNKKAYVKSRGRWSKKSEYFLENYIDPPFFVDDVSKIKEYIR
jgi:hypothetical protein